MYDHSLRVPAAVRWPRRLGAGLTVDAVVLNIDWFPTLLAMADAALPEDILIRGKNFLPLLEQKRIPWRTAFYAEYDQKHVEKADQRMWRTRQWKLVRDSREGMDELYHLSSDPGERRNLIDDPRPQVRKAVERLDRALRRRERDRTNEALVKLRRILLCLLVSAAPAAAQGEVSFAKDIEPILARDCMACHGPALQQNGLRLDRREDAMNGGKSGPAIEPGRSAQSLLMKRLDGLDGLQRMPPGRPLPREQVELFREWIDQGAKWESDAQIAAPPRSGHWAFRPNRRPAVPQTQQNDWPRNPIDAFVLARLEREGIQPSPAAPAHTLLRRASLDLTGLPPAADGAETAGGYEQFVDRLLQSEHFGERWAAPWLDQVRYADSDGYEKDLARPHAWRYRHWVIDALNADMPFDRFTLEQLAGDLLPDASVEQRVATGFYRNTLKNREGGVAIEQFRFEEVVDRTNTVATVWLGLSVECARCHDHKFDPIPQSDYYRLSPFSTNWTKSTSTRRCRAKSDLICGPSPSLTPRLPQSTRNTKCASCSGPGGQNALGRRQPRRGAPVGYELGHHRSLSRQRPTHPAHAARTAQRTRRLCCYGVVSAQLQRVTGKEEYAATGFRDAAKELNAAVDSFPDVSRARVIEAAREPRRTHLHERGEWDAPGEPVVPGALAALPPLRYAGAQPTRLDLARWIASPENPLTARVAVNRIWQEYFGSGLVATANDFGFQGEKPSHPDLLDWLASELIDSGWSLKRIHRLIVTSAVYRQSSNVRPELTAKDPGNRLLARQTRLRLPAESLRDAALAVSGLLDTRVGGRSVRPPQPAGVAELAYAGSVKWNESTGGDRYRRGLYIHYQRTAPYPFLANFDLGERNVASCTRGRSNTPLQALNLLNDPVFWEIAQGLALRILTEAPAGAFAERLDHAYKLCLARTPRVSEREEMLGYFVHQRKLLEADPAMAKAWFPAALDGIDTGEAAAWVGIGRILLNLDEFLTRE